MKITLKIILTIVLMFPLFAQAQNNTAAIEQIGNDNSSSIGQTGSAQWAKIYQESGYLGTNQAALNQNGSCNLAYIAQLPLFCVSSNNAEITQTNSGNKALVVQAGAGNESKVVQDGWDNHLEVSIFGQRIYAELNQSGTGNRITQQLSGEGLNFTLIQTGNNNSLTQIEDGTAAKNYTVIQNGNGMDVKVIQSNIFRN